MSAQICLHASCVAVGGCGIVIRGQSGSGKSALSLQLMAYGADLVADDRVLLSLENGRVVVRPPNPIKGLIEARGVGILKAQAVPEAQLCGIVDLDRVEEARLPAQTYEEILGQNVPVLYRVEVAHFAPALLQYMKGGALDPDA